MLLSSFSSGRMTQLNLRLMWRRVRVLWPGGRRLLAAFFGVTHEHPRRFGVVARRFVSGGGLRISIIKRRATTDGIIKARRGLGIFALFKLRATEPVMRVGVLPVTFDSRSETRRGGLIISCLECPAPVFQ